MADEIDIADEVAETILQAQIERARTEQEKIVATGYCLSCGETLNDSERRWCDADCRDDWEREHRDIV